MKIVSFRPCAGPGHCSVLSEDSSWGRNPYCIWGLYGWDRHSNHNNYSNCPSKNKIINKASHSPITLISKGGKEEEKEKEEEGEEIIVGKDRLDWEKGPATKKSKGARQIKWETAPQHITLPALHSLSGLWAQTEKPNLSGILGEIMACPEIRDFGHCLRRWDVPKKHNHIASYQKTEEAMMYLLINSAMW